MIADNLALFRPVRLGWERSNQAPGLACGDDPEMGPNPTCGSHKWGYTIAGLCPGLITNAQSTPTMFFQSL